MRKDHDSYHEANMKALANAQLTSKPATNPSEHPSIADSEPTSPKQTPACKFNHLPSNPTRKKKKKNAQHQATTHPQYSTLTTQNYITKSSMEVQSSRIPYISK